MDKRQSSCSAPVRNDRVDGLKAKVATNGKKNRIKLSYTGKYGQGYDGCGTHTHK